MQYSSAPYLKGSETPQVHTTTYIRTCVYIYLYIGAGLDYMYKWPSLIAHAWLHGLHLSLIDQLHMHQSILKLIQKLWKLSTMDSPGTAESV